VPCHRLSQDTPIGDTRRPCRAALCYRGYTRIDPRTDMQSQDEGGHYHYCPTCGHALESRQLKAGDPKRLVCTKCAFVLYLDPKVAVGTIIAMPDRRIVLVRRAIEPGYGRWVFPGGYVDRGEVVSAAALREAREEAGIEIRLDGLVSIYSYAGRPPVIIVYAATATGSDLRHDEESLEIGTFSEAEIPWDDLAFRSTHEALRDYYAGVLHEHCR
jgi:8-oxo-dGTP diphosphatase